MKRRYQIGALIALVCVGGAIGGYLVNRTTHEDRMPLDVAVRVLETVPDLMARNASPRLNGHFVHDRFEVPDDGVIIPQARASERAVEDPSQITLTYAAEGCPITFPPGRQMGISYSGPVVTGGYIIYPMETMAWDEMQAMVARTVDLFEAAGWPVKLKPRFGPPTVIRREVTREQFDRVMSGTKFVVIGKWTPCDAPHVEVRAEVRHLNSSPSGPSIPPLAATRPRDPDAPDRFVMLVDFNLADEAAEEEVRRLVDARRIAETGSTDEYLPLSRWLEDPNWRPEGWDGRWVP